MGRLDWARDHVAGRQFEMFAFVASKHFMVVHLHDGFETFPAHFSSLGRVEAEALDDVGRGTAAGAEFGTTVAKHVQCSDALGDHEGVVQGQQDDA